LSSSGAKNLKVTEKKWVAMLYGPISTYQTQLMPQPPISGSRVSRRVIFARVIINTTARKIDAGYIPRHLIFCAFYSIIESMVEINSY
jgi:hypothetical protein